MPQEVVIQDIVHNSPGREREGETRGGKSCIWKESISGKDGGQGEKMGTEGERKGVNMLTPGALISDNATF